MASKAGVHGVLFSVESADASTGSGAATVTVDPSSFRAAFGGDYASRLHLVQLPACALTTPELAQCQRQTPVQTAPGAPLTATVQLALPAAGAARTAPLATTEQAQSVSSTATVLAATSAPDGSSGTYSATSLSPAGTWSSGGNTGAFTYAYPIQAPKSIAGPAPDLSLSYDSSS
ncbi:hypothetical protein ACFZB9_30985, partial [Kitasatospora sp. NPDC008050]|uniref:hypothetical protein n=1 Tax=Kitasatospora sp. NPDC008050 TaxID=3364021 RepID=UPI0036EBACA5